MPRFLIPTRNRPAPLRELLRFLVRFYPGTSLLLADGSDDQMKGEVQEVVAAHGDGLDIRYSVYPADLPFFERMLDAVCQAEDEYLALGADDDFPLVEAYDEAQEVLISREDVVTVVPCDVVLTQAAPGKLSARLSHSRSILMRSPLARARNFAWWSFATSYGVTLRDVLIERYRMLAKYNCPGFIDFQVGVNDAISGRILASDGIGTIRTQTYQHGYYRPTQPLVYLRHAERILAYRDHVAGRLMETGLEEAEAMQSASNLVDRRVAELTGQSAPTRHGFRDTPGFNQPVHQEQYRKFYAMFEEGNDVRPVIEERLRYVADILTSGIAVQTQDKVENYETI